MGVTDIRDTSWVRNDEAQILVFFKIFFNVYLFLRQRETEHEWGRGRERGRHRIRSRLQAPAVNTEPDAGFELTNREIMT